MADSQQIEKCRIGNRRVDVPMNREYDLPSPVPGDGDSMSVNSLLERVQREGTPLIDGDQVTFVWHGSDPPLLRGDFNDWNPETGPRWQTQGRDLYVCHLAFPPDAYLEYCYGPDNDRMADPFNQRRVNNGFGQYNHFFYLPPGAPTPLTRRQRSVSHGTVSHHVVDTGHLALGSQRAVTLYQPPVREACPLLVVYDGADYYRRAGLANTVDNLLGGNRIRPVALAFVANAGHKGRLVEYGCCEGPLLFLLGRVLPLSYQVLHLLDPTTQPGMFAVMGASMGGLMALYTALRLPHLFGHVLSQSGAFQLDGHETVTFSLVRDGAVNPVRIWMDVGKYEWLLEPNRKMHALLQSRGYAVSYREYPGGHNYTAWSNDLWRGLEHLFPPLVAPDR